jgi:hypothetical protein
MQVLDQSSRKPTPARSRCSAVEIPAPLVPVVEAEVEVVADEDGEEVVEDTEGENQ